MTDRQRNGFILLLVLGLVLGSLIVIAGIPAITTSEPRTSPTTRSRMNPLR